MSDTKNTKAATASCSIMLVDRGLAARLSANQDAPFQLKELEQHLQETVNKATSAFNDAKVTFDGDTTDISIETSIRVDGVRFDLVFVIQHVSRQYQFIYIISIQALITDLITDFYAHLDDPFGDKSRALEELERQYFDDILDILTTPRPRKKSLFD